jgi:hypothetical protein
MDSRRHRRGVVHENDVALEVDITRACSRATRRAVYARLLALGHGTGDLVADRVRNAQHADDGEACCLRFLKRNLSRVGLGILVKAKRRAE